MNKVCDALCSWTWDFKQEIDGETEEEDQLFESEEKRSKTEDQKERSGEEQTNEVPSSLLVGYLSWYLDWM